MKEIDGCSDSLGNLPRAGVSIDIRDFSGIATEPQHCSADSDRAPRSALRRRRPGRFDSITCEAAPAPAEQLECCAWLGFDLGRVLGEGAELFSVEQRFIDACRRRFGVDFLVNGRAALLGLSVSRDGRETAENQAHPAPR
jgi:hypothetical protein